MKKGWIVVVLAAFCLLALPMAAVAQGGPHFQKGNLDVSAGVGLGLGGVSLYPGAEYTITSIPITKTVPIVIGVEGKGLITFGSVFNVFGAAAMATGHFSFRTLELETRALDPVDVYIGLGLAFTSYSFVGGGFDNSFLRFASVEGINYFLNEKLALFVEYNYWGYSGGTVGVLFKF